MRTVLARENVANKKLYKMFGLSEYTDVPMYRCVCCGEPVCIDDSYSDRGNRLICGRCVRTKFNSISEALNWTHAV